jgi:hypothetical protein
LTKVIVLLVLKKRYRLFERARDLTIVFSVSMYVLDNICVCIIGRLFCLLEKIMNEVKENINYQIEIFQTKILFIFSSNYNIEKKFELQNFMVHFIYRDYQGSVVKLI